MNQRFLLVFLLFILNTEFVAAQNCNCCPEPTEQPTLFTVNLATSVSISAGFTGASNVDGYLVIRSTSQVLGFAPVNLNVYNAGASFGAGQVVGNILSSNTNFTASSLSGNTSYYFFIYSFKNCAEGRKYMALAPLTGTATTVAVCAIPLTQPTGLVFSGISTTTISGSFNGTTADEYLVVISTSSGLSANPANGIIYNVNDLIGNGTVISRGSGTTFTLTGLTAGTLYYFFVFSLNNSNCTGGPVYRILGPLTASQSTKLPVCTQPVSQPTAISFNTVTYNSINGSFTAATGITEYLVLASAYPSLNALPQNGIIYTTGTAIGNATVMGSGTATNFTATQLSSNTTYYFYIFSYKNSSCQNGPIYLTLSPLTGNIQTLSPPVSALNFYFGNLHSHSSYSDGNADDVSKIPADDYNFAKTALCMDFLGICEHNHATAGMSLSSWQPGIDQANNATTSSFVALTGMEWGTISTGGHVVVYGIDSLIGWEPNNYQVYVAEGDYTGPNGLFSIINRNGNAFGYYAHPNNSDFNNILGSSFDSTTYKAIIGSAVESGPAFSTSTTYNDYPTSMGYLSYYRSMLAKGYKLGPSMDHDNHNMTFGKTVTSRLVILATSLSKNNLLVSMKQRRFYASQDCSARISFGINNIPMGSSVSQSGAPVISVSSITSATVSSLKLMMGVPGSGATANILTSVATGSLNYTDNALTAGSTRYYYLDITESDGKRIITAPIWYTRQ